MSLAVARWVRATERDFNPADHPRAPAQAPGGIGGQFISGLIHGLVGGHGGGGQGPDVRRGTGRFATRGGSVVSLALPSRAPRVDDRVRDPRTGKLGRVLTISPVTDTRYFRPGETEPRAGQLHPASARVAWDDGRVETRPLSELRDPFAEQPLRDPARSFDMPRGPEPRRMDTAVASGIPGRPRTAAERMRDAVAGGRVESGVAKRLLRGESPTSIVDSGTKEGWRDAQRAKLSIAQRDALNGLGADQQELYWLRRAAGQDHGAAMDSVGAPEPVRKAAAARKMAAPKAPRAAKKAAVPKLPEAAEPDESRIMAGAPTVPAAPDASPAVAKMARGQRANASKVRQDLLATPHAERYAYLERLGLSQAQARALAKDLGVRGQERSTAPEILGRVVSHFEAAGDEAALARLGDAPSVRPIEDYVDWQAMGRVSPAGEKAAAKMARGKAPTGPRSSDLPAKPTLTDFEDLADRISRLRTEEQRLEILQDLNAGELNRLAGRFPGGVGINPSGYMSQRQTALKIPAGLSLEERRRWLARELTPAEQRRPQS